MSAMGTAKLSKIWSKNTHLLYIFKLYTTPPIEADAGVDTKLCAMEVSDYGCKIELWLFFVLLCYILLSIFITNSVSCGIRYHITKSTVDYWTSLSVRLSETCNVHSAKLVALLWKYKHQACFDWLCLGKGEKCAHFISFVFSMNLQLAKCDFYCQTYSTRNTAIFSCNTW